MRGLSTWGKPFNLLINMMNAIGTLGIFVLMILICVDVSMRAIFSSPLVGIPEIVKLGIVSIVFLQAAHTLAVGRFTSSDMFINWLEKQSRFAAKCLRSFFMLCGALLFSFVALGALDQFSYAYETLDFIGSQGIFTIPVWPMHAVILFGTIALSIQFCISAAAAWFPSVGTEQVSKLEIIEEEVV